MSEERRIEPEVEKETDKVSEEKKEEKKTEATFRSIKSINQELEQMIVEISEVKAKNTKTDLENYLKRANELKKMLQNPDIRAESYRNAQAPRSYRNIRNVYYEITNAANVLADAGIDTSEIKDGAISAKKDYNASLDRKEEAVLKVLISGNKGFAGDAHLIELQKKELARKQGGREQYVKKKDEIDAFLDRIDEVDIDTYEKNDKIAAPLEEINQLLRSIETLEQKNKKLEEEKKTIRKEIREAQKALKTETDKTKIDDLNATINAKKDDLKSKDKEITSNKTSIGLKKEKAKELATEFSKNNLIVAKSILQPDGEISMEGLAELNATVLPEAQEKRDAAARAIADKIGVEDGVAGAMLGGSKGTVSFKEIRKYLSSLKDKGTVSYDDAIRNMKGIVHDLSVQRKRSNDIKAEIDVIDREIRAIEGNIKMLEGRQPKPEPAKAGNGRGVAGNYFSDKVKSAKEYEAAGVAIDQVYLNKTKEERFEERKKFVSTLYPKNIPFKRLRVWFRAKFNYRDIEYAMSHKKAQKELAETTLASAYRNTMKVLEKNPNMTIEEAQTEALRNMLKREMGREMVDENAR